MDFFNEPTGNVNELALRYVTREFGKEYETVLLIAEAIAQGRRIPQIEDVAAVSQQIEDRNTGTEIKQSTIYAEAIINAWKTAAGKRSAAARAMDFSTMQKELASGNTDKVKELMGGFSGLGSLMGDPEVTALRERAEAIQKDMKETESSYTRESLRTELEDVQQQIQERSLAAMHKTVAPRESFRLAAQIVALGRGSVDDDVYDLVTSIID